MAVAKNPIEVENVFADAVAAVVADTVAAVETALVMFEFAAALLQNLHL
jgi:hypothetical protein